MESRRQGSYKRFEVPSYGFSVQGGKLIANKSELKIFRLIVELIQREVATGTAKLYSTFINAGKTNYEEDVP